MKRLSENKGLSNVVNIQNLLQSDSSSQDLQNKLNGDSNMEVKFTKIPATSKDVIPEVDENDANAEVEVVATNTPLINTLSHEHKTKSVSSSYLNQIKQKKNSIGSSTEISKMGSHKLIKASPAVYGNELSVEKKEEVCIVDKLENY